jgi:hypothetical protein
VVDVVSISAYTAAWAMDAAKQPVRTPASLAARDARRMELRQKRGDAGVSRIDSPFSAVQSAAAALDTMIEGERQPQSTMRQAIESYGENG